MTRAAREGRTYQPEPGRGKPWAFVVDVAPPGAKRRQVRRKGFLSEREAKTELRAVLSELDTTGRFREPSRESLGVFLEEWLTAVRPTVKATTWAGYAQKLRTHVVPKIGDRPLATIDAGVLNGLYADLLATGNRRGKLKGTPLGDRTVRHVHKILHRALRDAVKWGRLGHNPADDADPPRPQQAEMAVWSPEQLATFLGHVADDRLYPLWLLAVTTGMRRGELLGLRWADVDLEGGFLSVQQTLVAVGYKVETSTPKTKAGRRRIALDGATVEALRSWRKRQVADRLALGTWPDHGLVFTREDGALIHPQTLSFWFGKAMTSAKLPKLPLHGLRHSSATVALACGVHPKVVQERLGHSSIAITLDLYSHVAPGMQEEAADAIARTVGALS